MVVLSAGPRPIRAAGEQDAGPAEDLLGRIELPAEWRAQFWGSSAALALLRKSPKGVAELVPVQAGLRFCRCPACGADESGDPLAWSIELPKVLKCRRCGVTIPNEKYPAKVNNAIPEETIEVLPGVVHHYPYHAVEEGKARYPDERLYLEAKRDYEARKFLSRAALYSALQYRDAVGTAREAKLSVLACVIILRFAQVYPAYAAHNDQPGRPKCFQPARLRPPLRRGYQTGKWEWSGSLEVPMNLVLASALLRNDPAWAQAGKLLGESAPERTVDRDLFRAAAEFARVQPEEFSEESLRVYSGMLAVGKLLEDRALQSEAMARLDGFMRRGFYHDGFWRQGEIQAHRRVVDQLDGWFGVMLAGEPGTSVRAASSFSAARAGRSSREASRLPILNLARKASASFGARVPGDEIKQASWPSRPVRAFHGGPVMLGGAGLARLSVGEASGALDLEVRGLDSYGGPHFQRLALRLLVGGRPVLDDLDERAATTTGWDLATASHNVVVVDGLNQRETPLAARSPAAGSDFLFFAADPDFQVVSAQDPRAYPQSTRRYRHTVVVTASARARYAVSVFEVEGGLQHDQIYHAAPGRNDKWSLSVPVARPPASLLPSSITFLPGARPDQGRWFVQSYGEFQPDAQARLVKPAVAVLVPPGQPADPSAVRAAAAAGDPLSEVGVRLHLLGDGPMTAFTAESPNPARTALSRRTGEESRRAGLILRRRSEQGETLNSTFVTVLEPLGKEFAPLRRVGRVSAERDLVALFVETIDGPEYVIINLNPGSIRRVPLPGVRYTSFDGLAVRVREGGLVLAGGTFAEGSGKLVSRASLVGALIGSGRQPTDRGLGWFLTPDRLADLPSIAGRTLIIQHGDGTCRSWTLDSLESVPGGTRLHVREEPGFAIDPRDRAAHYYQFPQVTAPGPHRFRLAQIAR
jgi:hypothetical protein